MVSGGKQELVGLANIYQLYVVVNTLNRCEIEVHTFKARVDKQRHGHLASR